MIRLKHQISTKNATEIERGTQRAPKEPMMHISVLDTPTKHLRDWHRTKGIPDYRGR